MATKYFRSSRPQGVLLFMAIGFVLSAALLVAALRMDGIKALLAAVVAAVLLGLVAWAGKRRSVPVGYELGMDELVLRRGAEAVHLPLEAVLDANLIDRFTARDYVVQAHLPDTKGSSQGKAGPSAVETHYCGVPLGMGRAAAIYAGLAQLSTRDFRRSLVLLRVHGGSAYLLSPKHGSRMVSSLGNALGEIRKEETGGGA